MIKTGGNPLHLWNPQTIFAGMNDTQCTPKGCVRQDKSVSNSLPGDASCRLHLPLLSGRWKLRHIVSRFHCFLSNPEGSSGRPCLPAPRPSTGSGQGRTG